MCNGKKEKRYGKPNGNAAFLAAMNAAANAHIAKETAAATAASARGAQPVVNMDIFQKPADKPKKPIKYAIGFLKNHHDKEAVNKGLQGTNLTKLEQTLDAHGKIKPVQEAMVLEAATNLGFKFPDATNG